VSAYYNEHDPKAAAWLRELIRAGLIAPGEVDERSICDVRADELMGYTQFHSFAGIGGWSYALRLAGWPDDEPVWTGSCPCQPHSGAASERKRGFNDPRDLWPRWFRLIGECGPRTVFGEQVDDSVAWIDRMYTDMEGAGFAVAAIDLPACAADAPQERMRTFFVAHANRSGFSESSRAIPMGKKQLCVERTGCGSRFGDHFTAGEPGRTRRHEPSIRLLAHGVPGRVGLLRGYGNAIVPQVAAEFIRASFEALGLKR
jgi:DNA (cytosine-5)-methyltransferase 1